MGVISLELIDMLPHLPSFPLFFSSSSDRLKSRGELFVFGPWEEGKQEGKGGEKWNCKVIGLFACF